MVTKGVAADAMVARFGVSPFPYLCVSSGRLARHSSSNVSASVVTSFAC